MRLKWTVEACEPAGVTPLSPALQEPIMRVGVTDVRDAYLPSVMGLDGTTATTALVTSQNTRVQTTRETAEALSK